jgi:hypothetical protein
MTNSEANIKGHTVKDLVDLLHKTANTKVDNEYLDVWRSDIKDMEDALAQITSEIQEKNKNIPFDIVWKRKYEYIYNSKQTNKKK